MLQRRVMLDVPVTKRLSDASRCVAQPRGQRQEIHLNVRIFGRSPRMPARKDRLNVRGRGARPLPQVTGDFPSAADPA